MLIWASCHPFPHTYLHRNLAPHWTNNFFQDTASPSNTARFDPSAKISQTQFHQTPLKQPNQNSPQFANLASTSCDAQAYFRLLYLMNPIRLSFITRCILQDSPIPANSSARTSNETITPKLEV
ncbi:hypothetical protein HOY80DRAFT_885248 [Tuber brumale]|nr:hypothetical protein HOY80DRAFT_894387 [Tuber brumale]KAG0640106.1 hypothetical protein HOY80DRAFT_885248 [Tuber brumale]